MEHSAAGFLMEKELKYLKGAVDVPTQVDRMRRRGGRGLVWVID
jgi:hypothetical protein